MNSEGEREKERGCEGWRDAVGLSQSFAFEWQYGAELQMSEFWLGWGLRNV